MAKNIRVRAEQEADKIGALFAYSSDVMNDMSRIYHVDFSKIQIHTDEVAHQKVQAAGKDGMTQGNHLFFGRGIFESNAPEDKMLVAHELVHTMQQHVTDGGMAVGEHVPMGTVQYGGRIRKNRFDEYTRKAIEEEQYVPENEDEDGNFVLTEEEIDKDEAAEAEDYEEWNTYFHSKYEIHHYATNKHSFYSKIFANIARCYGLDLDGGWNKERLLHHGRHTVGYHEMVLKEMIAIHEDISQNRDKIADTNPQIKFLKLFEQRIKEPVRKDPRLLYT